MRLERWLLFLIGWLSAAYFVPRDPGWNVNTRLALTMAIVDEHRLTIDSYHNSQIYGTGDKAFVDGHFYSDKAIGNALFAVAPYQIARWLGVPMTATAKHWISSAFTVALAFGALLVVLAGLFERQGVEPRHASLLALLGGLGTMLFPYATLLMPYVPATLFAMLAYRLSLRDDEAALPLWRFAAAGLCMGVSVMFEFLYGLIGIAIWIHLLINNLTEPTAQPNVRRITSRAALGASFLYPLMGLIGVAPYLIYSWHLFGSLTIPYEYEFDPFFREAMALGFAGIHFPPDPRILLLITFHPFRGLFVLSPLLLLALPGFAAMWRLPHGPKRVAMCAGLFIGYLFVNGGYLHQWWGGWACGPRLLIPAIPFLLLPIAAAWGRWPRMRTMILAFAVLSIAIQLLAAGIDPQPPTPIPSSLPGFEVSASEYLMRADLTQWYPAPISTTWWPRLREGIVSNSLGGLLGLPGAASWIPLIALWVGFSLWVARSQRRESDPNLA